MRSLALVSLALAVSIPAQGTPPGPVNGTCMLAGGGKLPPEIPARFVELAGGDKAHIVLIPTASQSADDPKENESLLRLWRDERGASAVEVLHTRDRAKANDEAFVLPLRNATGVWIGGGTQKRLADAYLGTLVEKELMALLARGGVIGGTSAGTAIQTRTMIQEGMDPPIVATGFDFVPGAISDQHFLKRKRLPRLLKVLSDHPALVGIGVDESTAAEIRGDSLRVIGASKAVLVLAAQNGHDDVVREVEPFGPKDQPIDLGAWRRAAKERATWSLTGTPQPQPYPGALLLGEGDETRELFLTLGGGLSAQTVVVGVEPEAVLATRNLLFLDGATDTTELVLKPTADPSSILANAARVVLLDASADAARSLLESPFRTAIEASLRATLSRGGAVWAHGVLGDVVADQRAPHGYLRGFGLLPGTMITTGGAAAEPFDRCAERLPRLAAIRAESAAVVEGGALQVIGPSPAHVSPSHADGKPGDEREKITLEPGTKWDLVAQKKL